MNLRASTVQDAKRRPKISPIRPADDLSFLTVQPGVTWLPAENVSGAPADTSVIYLSAWNGASRMWELT